MLTRRTRERLDAEAGDHPAGGGVGALAGDACSQADGDGAAAAPRVVFCDVTGRRDLAQRAAAAFPGSRFVWRRSWLADPGERRARAGHRSARRVAVGMWLWSGAEEELLARANDVLLRFVHPLMARGLPYCIGFPRAAPLAPLTAPGWTSKTSALFWACAAPRARPTRRACDARRADAGERTPSRPRTQAEAPPRPPPTKCGSTPHSAPPWSTLSPIHI